MPRRFNTTGPSVLSQHYLLDPLARFDLSEVEDLITQGKYFVLHAPRQTGKTTSLLALMHYLNTQGQYQALYANIEGAQTARHDVQAGIGAVVQVLARRADIHRGDTRLYGWVKEAEGHNPHDLLCHLLTRWARETKSPIVLMLDEVDALVGDTLVSLLRQLREGYDQRPASYPLSIILCGIRDVRDYRIHTTQEGIITGGSCFNIKAESLRLGNFTAEEMQSLWRQHSDDTGQSFAPEIFAPLWEDTRGQPWLVNALGNECTWRDKAARDRTLPITLERYRAARESLIQSRATHLDQLTDKLRENRVRRVIAPILAGASKDVRIADDDQQYVEDLGLIRSRPVLEISNNIYREVIPRNLTWIAQTRVDAPTTWYLRSDHSLDMYKLLAAFQHFFRENSDIWLERFDYKEAGPQLLMQAFLQRVINGGGRINREYGLGLRRTDLFIEWPLDEVQGFYGPVQRIVIELKILHKSLQTTISEGLAQTADYAVRCDAAEAHLVIFNRDPPVDWDDKIWQRDEMHGDRVMGVWGA